MRWQWTLGACAVTWCVAHWWHRRGRARDAGAVGASGTGGSATPGIREGLAGLIGNTPLVRLPKLSAALGCTVLAKAEFLNPGGSAKDRVARQIVLDAIKACALPTDGSGTIVEGTSGSTGISLALMARAMGLRCCIVMPDDQAKEKSDLLTMFGAAVERVKNVAIVNNKHYVNLARSKAAQLPGGLFTDQFENMSNFAAHYTTTGPEIWRQSGGRVDAFVMGSGTGGTIAGVSRFLKEQNPATRVFLVDPQGSSLYNKVKHGVVYAPEQAESRLKRHRYDTIVEGVGLGRLTANFAEAIIDDAFRISDAEAVMMSRWLLRHEGIFCGSSTGLNLAGVVRAARTLKPGSTIVTVLCDSGQRHVTRLWSEAFLASAGLSGVCDALPADSADMTFIR